MADLKNDMIKNTIWSSIEKFSTLGIQIISTFILARFLSPYDFGILGLLTVFSSFSNCLIDSGFSQALIRDKYVTKSDYSSVLYFNIIIALILYIILFSSSNLIANFFNIQELDDISKCAFLALPLNAMSLVQNTILTKELRFKKLCIISLSSSIITSIITIILALHYRNVWVLVFQLVFSTFLRNILLWVFGDFWPNFIFSFNVIKKYFAFSKNLLLSGIIGNVFGNIYSIIIGKNYSIYDLGFYSQAEKIKNVISHNTTNVIQGVSYPVFVKLNNSGDNIIDAYKKIISVSLVFVGGLMTLVMVVSSDLFELFMGSHWRTAGIYFLLLGINGILYPLHSINQNILLVSGDSKTILFLEIFRRCIMILILLITSIFNVYVFAAGLSLYSFVLLFINMHYCGKPIKYDLKNQLIDTFPILGKLFITICIGIFMNYILSDIYYILRIIICELLSLSLLIYFFKRDSNVIQVVDILYKKFKI